MAIDYWNVPRFFLLVFQKELNVYFSEGNKKSYIISNFPLPFQPRFQLRPKFCFGAADPASRFILLPFLLFIHERRSPAAASTHFRRDWQDKHSRPCRVRRRREKGCSNQGERRRSSRGNQIRGNGERGTKLWHRRPSRRNLEVVEVPYYNYKRTPTSLDRTL